MKPIAILGTGPAGLLAAHAVALSGRPVAMFTAPNDSGGPRKSPIGGAQFLHSPIPGVHENGYPDRVITYRVEGTAEQYQKNVYGETNVPFVSFSNVADGQAQDAWSLITVYDRLWSDLSCDRANVVEVDSNWVQEALDKEWFDLVISTIPALALCRSRHTFAYSSITVAPETILDDLPDDTVFYNGTSDRSWYRTSRLFGVGGTEWGAGVKVPDWLDLPTIQLDKPLSTKCDCFDDKVVKLGRMGKWKKGVLAHDGFYGAQDALLKL